MTQPQPTDQPGQQELPEASPAVSVREVRLLEGPNLYFPRPAVKVSLTLPGYQAADTATMRHIAGQAGMRRAAPGPAHSAQRHRFLVRLAATVLRRIAQAAGTRVGVRARSTSTTDEVVLAFPWKHRGRANALGEALGPVLLALLEGDAAAGAEAITAAGLATNEAGEHEPGPPPAQLRPRVPVASVTGTNGKTSTTRLLAHMGMLAGRHTGWSSTEGVFIQGEKVVAGDYSGPSGARQVLQADGLELGILETARGGLLLKGMGVVHNDVSVVTNVTADHLGLHGVDTLDQLAEVKGIVTRVTKKDGWVVLNGDDPRVRAMAGSATGRVWMFSLDPDSPALREAVDAGGRGITVLDDDIVILRRDADPDRIARVVDVPMTLSGLSRHNLANALAAVAAGLGLGLPREAVVTGLRTFAPDLEHNPGRMNVFSLPLPYRDGASATVILDLAHNEAGLDALLDVARGLRPPGARVHLGLGGVGDRSDEVLQGLGSLAGRRADRVQIVHKGHYLRGREVEDLEGQFVQGLAVVGAVPSGCSPTEVDGMQALAEQLADGDVAALMLHADRPAVLAWLEEHGARPDSVRTVRRKVIAARGEHELESVLAAVAVQTGADRVAAARDLVEATGDDPRLRFELGSALDADGQEQAAVGHYQDALAHGLREPHRFRAQVQLASSLRQLGRVEDAEAVLTELDRQRPDDPTTAVLRALLQTDRGRPELAVADLVEHLLLHATDPEAVSYRPALQAYATQLRDA